MDQEVFELMASYKSVIDYLLQKNEELEKKLADVDAKASDLESMIFDEIIGPAQEAMSTYDKDQRFNEFKDKYGERLGKYQDSFAPMEDEGFDFTRQAFDEYDNIPDEYKPDMDAYVDEVENVAQDKLAGIKKALGIPEDANLEIKETDDTVEVKADGETVEVEQKEGGDGEAVEEETAEESAEEPEDGESVEDFEASLKKSL
jgi:hypothetical protein